MNTSRADNVSRKIEYNRECRAKRTIEFIKDSQLYASNAQRQNRYDWRKDVACQISARAVMGYESPMRAEVVCYSGFPKSVYAYTRTRSFTNVGVGSECSQKKRVRKIYLPETENRGVGSSDLSPLIDRKTRYERDCNYARKQTSSKCVGGAIVNIRRRSEKLSPIDIHNPKGITSNVVQKKTFSKDIGNNTLEKNLTNTTTQVENIDKKQASSKIAKEMGPIDAVKSARYTTKKYQPTLSMQKSSDSLEQHVHNLEDPSFIQSTGSSDPMENKLEKEYRKMFSSNKTSKEDNKTATEKPINDLKSASLLRRRFEALKRGMAKKEETKKNTPPSKESEPVVQSSTTPVHKDISVESDPPSLEARSYSHTKVFSPPPSMHKHEHRSRHARKHSYTGKKENGRQTPIPKDKGDDTDVKGMFKLWGDKFNFEEEKKAHPVGVSFDTKGKDTKTKGNEPKTEKEGKRFFFFKKKSKDKGKQASCDKKRVTTGRCEVKDCSVLNRNNEQEIDAYLEEEILKKDCGKLDEEEISKKNWLKTFIQRTIESRKSLQIRWNNKTYTTSSSTVFELMDNMYRQANVVITTQSEASTISSYYPSYHKHRVNFVQDVEAWMIPKMIPHRHTPYMFHRNDVNNRISDRKWFIDKSKAFAHEIELVLNSKNFVRCHRTISSDYLRIDIPKGFFTDPSSDSDKFATSNSEEVYKVIEYESPESRSGLRFNVKNNIGDFSHNDVSMKQKVSVRDKNTDTRVIETVIKKPPAHRDVLIQGSNVHVPKRCDVIGVGIITHRVNRELGKSIINNDADVSEEESEQLRESKIKQCQFAESYLRDYYRHWMPLGIDLFPDRISDFHIKCESQETLLSSLHNQGDGTKSCPNIPNDYHSDVNLNPSSNSHGSCKDYIDRTKIFNTFKSTTQSEPATDAGAKRVLPKDSFEVLRKRMLYACGNRSRWNYPEDQPYSVPSIEDKAEQDALNDASRTSENCKKKCGKRVSITNYDYPPECCVKNSESKPTGILSYSKKSVTSLYTKRAKVKEDDNCIIMPPPCSSYCNSVKNPKCIQKSSKTSITSKKKSSPSSKKKSSKKKSASKDNAPSIALIKVAPSNVPCEENLPCRQNSEGSVDECACTSRRSIPPNNIPSDESTPNTTKKSIKLAKNCPCPNKSQKSPTLSKQSSSSSNSSNTSSAPSNSPSVCCQKKTSRSPCSVLSSKPKPQTCCGPSSPKPKTPTSCGQSPTRSKVPSTCGPSSPIPKSPPSCGQSSPRSKISSSYEQSSPRPKTQTCCGSSSSRPKTQTCCGPSSPRPKTPTSCGQSPTRSKVPSSCGPSSPMPKSPPPCEQSPRSKSPPPCGQSFSRSKSPPICGQTPTRSNLPSSCGPSSPMPKSPPICGQSPTRSKVPSLCGPSSPMPKLLPSCGQSPTRSKVPSSCGPSSPMSKSPPPCGQSSPKSRSLPSRRQSSPKLKGPCGVCGQSGKKTDSPCFCSNCCKKSPSEISNECDLNKSPVSTQTSAKSKILSGMSGCLPCPTKPCPRIRSQSKMSGVHLKMKPAPILSKCDVECPKIEDLERAATVSEEQILIRVKKSTLSTEDLGDSVNIKVQDADGKTLYERRDYKADRDVLAHKSSLLGDVYKTVNRMSTASDENLSVIDNDKRAKSISNMIEISFGLKVTQGDKIAELNLKGSNDEASKIETNCYDGKSQDVFIVKSDTEATQDDTNDKNDINIKIVIKNFDTKAVKPSRKNNTDKFSKQISQKFHTVSTGYSDVIGSHIDNMYSMHKTTIDLTDSKSQPILNSKGDVRKGESNDIATNKMQTRKEILPKEFENIGDLEMTDIDAAKQKDDQSIHNSETYEVVNRSREHIIESDNSKNTQMSKTSKDMRQSTSNVNKQLNDDCSSLKKSKSSKRRKKEHIEVNSKVGSIDKISKNQSESGSVERKSNTDEKSHKIKNTDILISEKVSVRKSNTVEQLYNNETCVPIHKSEIYLPTRTSRAENNDEDITIERQSESNIALHISNSTFPIIKSLPTNTADDMLKCDAVEIKSEIGKISLDSVNHTRNGSKITNKQTESSEINNNSNNLVTEMLESILQQDKFKYARGEILLDSDIENDMVVSETMQDNENCTNSDVQELAQQNSECNETSKKLKFFQSFHRGYSLKKFKDKQPRTTESDRTTDLESENEHADLKQSNKSLRFTDTDDQENTLDLTNTSDDGCHSTIVKPITKREKKEMLKNVFEKATNEKWKSKGRMQRLKNMLKFILTSDSSDVDDVAASKVLVEDITYSYQRPPAIKDTDSMNNYYRMENILHSEEETKVHDDDQEQSEYSDSSDYQDKSKCICHTMAEQLRKHGEVVTGGCCCRPARTITIHEQTSCNMNNDNVYMVNYKAAEYIDVQTQNSVINSRVTNLKLVNQVESVMTSMKCSPFERINEDQSVSPCRFDKECEVKNAKTNTVLGLLDDSKIVIRTNDSKRAALKTEIIIGWNGKDKKKHRQIHKTYYSNPSDVLQSYETKKAVLEIYTEKTVTKDGERLVAKLPKFVYDKEQDIEKNYVKDILRPL